MYAEREASFFFGKSTVVKLIDDVISSRSVEAACMLVVEPHTANLNSVGLQKSSLRQLNRKRIVIQAESQVKDYSCSLGATTCVNTQRRFLKLNLAHTPT